MKVLVTGSSGLIGSQVVKDLLEKNYVVYSCYNSTKPECGIPTNLNLLNKNEIDSVLTEIKPDSIIHLAALTDLEMCEKEKDLAFKINADATEIIAKIAAKLNSFLVYVSTDYVFDGKNGMKKEHDISNPLGCYGKSKLEGEQRLNKLASPYAIVRTSTPFGFHNTKKSFPIWIKENLESETEISVLTDQLTSPTYVPNLSKMVVEIAVKQIVGIIHAAGATKISRYSFAEKIAEKLSLDKKFLKPATMNEMNWIAQRPIDSSLDVSLASEILEEKPQTIQQSLDLMFSDL